MEKNVQSASFHEIVLEKAEEEIERENENGPLNWQKP
jgi:hypothetical protein